MATPGLRARIERTFAAVVAKDLDAALAVYADDGSLIDPHYPVPAMHGKAAIADGLRWAFGGMESFGFDITGFFSSEDGTRGAVEVQTHHVLKGGRRLDSPQAFVVDTRAGLITRMRAYEPYGPGGLAGLVIAMQRWRHRMRRKQG